MNSTTKSGWSAGRILISLVAVFTVVSPYLADWNETHIYNSLWTPHAKFHNAQTMAFGALLGALALYFLWGRHGDKASNVTVAVIFAGLYWVAQSFAFLFPGVASFDPEFAASAPPRLLGLPGQLGLGIIIFALLGIAYLLEQKRLDGHAGGKRRAGTLDA